MLPLYLILAAAMLAAPSATNAQEAVPREEVQQLDAGPEPSELPVRRAIPRTGTAVPRGTRRAPAPAERARVPDRRRTVIVRPPARYNNDYYYPRRSYPYGYGAFGLGYFYYDPYRWYPGAYSTYAGPDYYQSPYGYGFDIGELRLQVSPRHAQVYVDGYYAGTVDDYDGAFQALKLESGPYQIEIVAPGYETLGFDVRINPGQKITYRGDLRRRP